MHVWALGRRVKPQKHNYINTQQQCTKIIIYSSFCLGEHTNLGPDTHSTHTAHTQHTHTAHTQHTHSTHTAHTQHTHTAHTAQQAATCLGQTALGQFDLFRSDLFRPDLFRPVKVLTCLGLTCLGQCRFGPTRWALKCARLEPESPNVHISGSLPSKTPPKFNERTPKREKKERKLWRETEKKERNFGRSGGGGGVRRRAVLGRAVLGIASHSSHLNFCFYNENHCNCKDNYICNHNYNEL